MILDRIVAHKREELAARQAAQPLAEVVDRARQQDAPRDFAAALRGSDVALIAEVKKASPSRGVLSSDFDPIRLARSYREGGASAISVLTDERFFQGSLDHLAAVQAESGLPVLRKDFLFDPYQVYEARAAGADAVLLIVAILEQPLLRDLYALTLDLRMAALVEVHDEGEVDRALEAGAEIVGINNRDLRTFQVDLATTHRLRPRIPTGRIVVAESGIHTPADVALLREWDVQAMLVGESLVTSGDAAAKARELLTAIPDAETRDQTNPLSMRRVQTGSDARR